jgi:hypothetical protein
MSEMNPEPLFGRDKSPCCGYPQRIVRSRPGGYVTQNCTKCGEPRNIRLDELPKLTCPRCGRLMTADYDGVRNYAYRCPCGPWEYAVHEMVPAWQEEFAEHGHGIPGVDYKRD